MSPMLYAPYWATHNATEVTTNLTKTAEATNLWQAQMVDWQIRQDWGIRTEAAKPTTAVIAWGGNEEAMTGGKVWLEPQPATAWQWVEATPAPGGMPSARDLLVARNRARSELLRRKVARQRALEWLLERLTEPQRAEWATDQSFHVETADGKRRYKIKRGMHGNVTLVKADGPLLLDKHGKPIKVGASFCCYAAHPDGRVPEEDNVLAQMLMLGCPDGEREFVATANVTHRGPVDDALDALADEFELPPDPEGPTPEVPLEEANPYAIVA